MIEVADCHVIQFTAIGFLDTNKVNGMRQRKCCSSVLLARRPPAFHLRTLRESRREEAGGKEKQPGA